MKHNYLSKEKRKWQGIIEKRRGSAEKDVIVLNYCKDKEVLDVGCIGQDINYDSIEWIHNKIRKISRSVLGVDVDKEMINELNKKEFNIIHLTQISQIKRKFDIITILDVVEHVDDSVQFLITYSKFLKKDGKIIITTPNAMRAINFINILFRNTYSLNNEHTFWFCPRTMTEVVSRTKVLQVQEFFWLKYYGSIRKHTIARMVLRFFENVLLKIRSSFSPNFMIILELK